MRVSVADQRLKNCHENVNDILSWMQRFFLWLNGNWMMVYLELNPDAEPFFHSVASHFLSFVP